MAPNFPYKMLVRVPLVTITPLAFQLLFLHPLFDPLPRVFYGFHWWLDIYTELCKFLVVEGGAVQVVAVPSGLITAYRAGKLFSFRHNGAIICGISYLLLAKFVLSHADAVR